MSSHASALLRLKNDLKAMTFDPPAVYISNL